MGALDLSSLSRLLLLACFPSIHNKLLFPPPPPPPPPTIIPPACEHLRQRCVAYAAAGAHERSVARREAVATSPPVLRDLSGPPWRRGPLVQGAHARAGRGVAGLQSSLQQRDALCCCAVTRLCPCVIGFNMCLQRQLRFCRVVWAPLLASPPTIIITTTTTNPPSSSPPPPQSPPSPLSLAT